jgi:hypothetical protein
MATELCPRCGSADVTAGWIYGRGPIVRFRPQGLGLWSFLLGRGVSLKNPTVACLSCGLIWSSMPPEEIRAFIKRHGPAEAKAKLAAPKEPG